jgi:hypothetical protein
MTTRHTISRANQLFSHGAYYSPFNRVPGLPADQTCNYVPGGSLPPLPTDTGVIAAAAANNVATSQASTGGTNALAINGALATAGVATVDVARNIVAAWTGTAIPTITGTDFYGQTQTESLASGATSFTGKKAFKTVTSVTFSAAVTGATVGTGVKIGMPFLIAANGMLDALTDSLPDVTYTLVAGDQTSPATSLTGDVRGTIAASTAPNGTHAYFYNMRVYDRTGGIDKKSGAFGVTPA